MDKEFIPYKQALALKELGFDEPCFGWYQDNTLRLDINANQSIKFHEHLGRFKGCIIAPLYQQAFRWFREKQNLIGLVDGGYDNSKNIFTYVIWNDFRDDIFDDYYSTYEEAELACLIKLIEVVKNKTNEQAD
jgi:hypothetical protein